MCTRKTEKDTKMGKRKIKILNEVLSVLSAHFEDAEYFIKERLEEICSREKISVGEVIYFSFILLLIKPCVFGIVACGLLVFSIKNSCLLCNKEIF